MKLSWDHAFIHEFLKAGPRLMAMSCLLLVGLYPAGHGRADQAAEVDLPTPSRKADPGQSFKLTPGEAIHIERAGIMLRLKSLIYSPCPRGARCVWSGMGVMIEFRRGDGPVEKKLMPTILGVAPYSYKPKGRRYSIFLEKTDLKTFAVFAVHNAESWCETRTHPKELEHC